MSSLVTGDAAVLDLRRVRIPTRLPATAIDLTIEPLAFPSPVVVERRRRKRERLPAREWVPRAAHLPTGWR